MQGPKDMMLIGLPVVSSVPGLGPFLIPSPKSLRLAEVHISEALKMNVLFNPVLISILCSSSKMCYDLICPLILENYSEYQ